jgi:hypothetical protein
MSMSDIESRLQSFEARLREAESRAQRAQDQLDIYQLVATYGPGVDSLNEESVRNLWTEDGVYDPGGNPYVGNDAVGKLIYGDIHQGFVNKGCAHVMSMPHIVVDGDTAVATGYSNVFLRDGDHWRVERASANRWELVRTAAGWKVKHRLNRQLLGSDKSRRVLGSGLPPSSAAATGT